MTSDILIESFDVDIGASGSTHTLTNDVGAVANAFVRKVTGTDKANGRVGSTGNMNANDAHVGVELTGTDELTFTKTLANTNKIVGEVWRYTGAAGGANEFINRGSYAITLTGTSATQAVAGIVDRNRCVPIHNGCTTTGTTRNDFESACIGVHINASGEIVVERGNSNGTVVVYVTVVEFTGANWSVGHGISTSHDAAIETVTLNTDSTGAGGTTFDVGDWATAMIIDASMEGDTAETGLADVLALTQPAGNTTQVTFSVTEADGNGRNDGNGYVHVIQNDDLIVTRQTIASIAEGNNTYGTIGFPAGTATDRTIDQLSMEWFVSTSGTGTAHCRGRLTARVTDAAGTIQHWVHRSGNNVRVYFGVVDVSQLQSATPPAGTTATAALTQDDQTGASTADVGVGAQGSSTQDDQSMIAVASVDNDAQLSRAQDNNTMTATATVMNNATFSSTQQPNTASSQADIDIDATFTTAQDDQTALGQASTGIGATLTATQDDQVLSADIESTSANSLTGAFVQDNQTGASIATVDITANVGATQQSQTGASQTSITIELQGDASQADNTMSAVVGVSITATLSASQDDNTGTADADVDVDAESTTVQEGNTVAANATVGITASVSAIQGNNAIMATATVKAGEGQIIIDFDAFSFGELGGNLYAVEDKANIFDRDVIEFECYGGTTREFNAYGHVSLNFKGFME